MCVCVGSFIFPRVYPWLETFCLVFLQQLLLHLISHTYHIRIANLSYCNYLMNPSGTLFAKSVRSTDAFQQLLSDKYRSESAFQPDGTKILTRFQLRIIHVFVYLCSTWFASCLETLRNQLLRSQSDPSDDLIHCLLPFCICWNW